MAKKVVKSMITDFKKFRSAWEKDAGNPHESIMYYLIAALNVEKDPKLADAMMTLVVSKNDTVKDSASPSGMKLGRSAKYYVGQFKKNPNIPKSYVGGTSENNYKISKGTLRMNVVREQPLDDRLKIFIDCGGADSARPVQVAKNKHGQWKLVEYSSLCVGIKKPASEKGDF